MSSNFILVFLFKIYKFWKVDILLIFKLLFNTCKTKLNGARRGNENWQGNAQFHWWIFVNHWICQELKKMVFKKKGIPFFSGKIQSYNSIFFFIFLWIFHFFEVANQCRTWFSKLRNCRSSRNLNFVLSIELVVFIILI